jgi:hypothetical protein
VLVVFCLPNKPILQPDIYVTSLAAVEVLRVRDGGQDVINSVDVTCGLTSGIYLKLEIKTNLMLIVDVVRYLK